MSDHDSISRRRFLRQLGTGMAAAAAGLSWRDRLFAQDIGAASRVVVVSNPASMVRYEANAAEVGRSLSRGMMALTGEKSAADAWKKFVKPTDRVGLKVTSAGGSSFSTHLALIQEVSAGLQQAGVPASNILVWDKAADVMRSAGFPVESSALEWPDEAPKDGKVRFVATVPHTGYDDAAFYESNLAGRPAWGDVDFGKTEISTRSYFSRIVTQQVTKLICLPVMTDSRAAGLAGSLYTMASGAVDNTRRFAGPPSFFDPAASEICLNPLVKDKWCLTIADGLLAQYVGGPAFHPQYCWHHGTLYLSTDPVAVDALMLDSIERMREQAKLPKIGDIASHIQTAEAYQLGTAALARIKQMPVSL